MSSFILGLVAASLTTIAYVPQVVKTWKSKSSKDLSLKMLLTFCAGVCLWLIYGVLEKDSPIIVANYTGLRGSSCGFKFKENKDYIGIIVINMEFYISSLRE